MIMETMNEKIFLVKDKIKRDGVFKTLIQIIKSTSELVINEIFTVNKFVIAEKLLNVSVEIIKPKIEAEIKIIDKENLRLLKNHINKKQYHCYMNRLNQNSLGIFVFVGENIAGYLWAIFKNEKTKNGLNIPLKENEAFLKDGFVFPDYRRKRIHTFMKSGLLKILKEKNVEKVFTAFLEWNKYSERSNNSNQFREIKKIKLVKILGLKFQIESSSNNI